MRVSSSRILTQRATKRPLLLLFRQNCGHAVNFVPIYPLILFSQLTPQQINGDSQQHKNPTLLNGR